MSESGALDALRTDIDYQELVAKASPALQLYIRTLEQENARLNQEIVELRQSMGRRQRAATARDQRTQTAPSPVPTTLHPEDMMVITLTAQGQCKRTPLNSYSTQRRGGVGVLDIQTSRDDLVAHLLVARISVGLLVLTNLGRAFRFPVDTLPQTEVRGRGTSLPDRLALPAGESLQAIIALDDDDIDHPNLLIATHNGWVHSLRRNYVGPRLQPGTQLFDPKRGGGSPAALALARSQDDVLVALRSGIGIRFPQSLVRRGGVHGIKIKPADAVASITGVSADGAALLVTADGKGIRRLMAGFRANKSAGGQGKFLMNTDALVGAKAVGDNDEVLCISSYSKIIRFAAAEIPTKTSTVQGNAVMDCRDNRLAALALVPPPKS